MTSLSLSLKPQSSGQSVMMRVIIFFVACRGRRVKQ